MSAPAWINLTRIDRRLTDLHLALPLDAHVAREVLEDVRQLVATVREEVERG